MYKETEKLDISVTEREQMRYQKGTQKYIGVTKVVSILGEQDLKLSAGNSGLEIVKGI